jgi:hypothetical protein
MRATVFWKSLLASWRPPVSAMPSGPDDMFVHAPRQIQLALGEAALSGRGLTLQAADGCFLGQALLLRHSGSGVLAQFKPTESCGMARSPLHWPLNAAAPSPKGMLLFTLEHGQVDAAGQLSAHSPEQLIQVQSRSHFRLTALGGKRPRAWLRFANADTALPLRDLSEGGLRLDMPSNFGFVPPRRGAAELMLDGETLRVDELEVVHTRSSGAVPKVSLGMRIVRMPGDQQRALRRWVGAAQSSGCGPSEAQA